MTQPISTLHIAINATTDALGKGLVRAAQQISGFASGIGQLSAKAANAVGLGMGLRIGEMAIDQMSAWLGPQMAVVDALGKTADKLGISTEALGAYRHAAGLAGIKSEQLDKALQVMGRNVQAAAAGNKDMAGTFQLLGLSAATLATMTPDAALKRLADGLNTIPSQGQRAALAMKLFGEEAAGMTNLLAGGSAGLQAAEAEAAALGITLSRADVATVEQANDAMTRLGAAITGVIQHLAVGLAPIISAALATFNELGAGGSTAGQWIAGAFERVGRVVARLMDIGNGVLAVFQFLQASINRLLQWISAGFARLDEVTGNRLFGGGAEIFRQEFEKTSTELFGEAAKNWDEALSGTAGNAFIGKIEEAKTAADQIAANAANRIEAIEAPRVLAEEKKPKKRDDQTPAALAKGTAEAFSLAAKLGRTDPAAVAKQQLDATKAGLTYLKKIADGLATNILAAANLG